jgi:uncharacterized protein YecE (DUF72 family)
MGRRYIGTSGYNYLHWGDGVFYPGGLPQRSWLEYYVRYFQTVELNVSFYRLPGLKAFEGWQRRTPADFRFAAKGSRFITHIKRLRDCREPLEVFFKNAMGLKEKLSVVLWQLPPGLKADSDRLSQFSKELKQVAPQSVRQAFEFRNRTWFVPEVYEILVAFNFGLCIADSPRWPSEEVITTDFVYLRFHGGKVLYGSDYSTSELQGWARKAQGWLANGLDIYAYFNNDAFGFAVKNAQQFQEILSSSSNKA